MSNDICHSCHQKIKKPHQETMTKHKLTMLKAAAARVIATGFNDVKLNENNETNDYNNFQKLRYHGLVHHVRNTDGSINRGHWLITRNGWAFLRGDLKISKHVLVLENRIIEHSDTKLDVRQVYRGAEAIQTTFEYFDENGRMVGLRPFAHNPKSYQTTLGLGI